MTTPFEFAKSVTHTKESLFTVEEIFNKEYVPFMVNRSLSNSPQTVLFADMMNRYHFLDKKLQYDFYLLGIPKQKGYTKWIKKEADDVPMEQITYIANTMHISMERAIELHKILGSEVVEADMKKQGGRK